MTTRRPVAITGLSFVACLGSAAAGQSIRYVDDDASTNGDGLTWETAYNDLQDALTEAGSNGLITEIRVAGGIYRPDCTPTPCIGANGDREATFQLVEGVAVQGGYRGCPGGDCAGGDPDERDLDLYETILSGDLNSDDGPNVTSNGENSYHVVTSSYLSETTVLNGLTVSAGTADGEDYIATLGAGLLHEHANLTLVWVCFRDNEAKYGGGLWGHSGELTFVDCTFINNHATDEHGAGGGVGSSGGSLSFERCTFLNNSAGGGEPGYQGGGGVHIYSGEMSLLQCVFVGNTARSGGAITNSWHSTATLTDCWFSQNQVSGSDTYGGAIESGLSSLSIYGCTFLSNSAGAHGGAVRSRSGDATLVDCEFVNNTSAISGGAVSSSAGDLIVDRCTFTDNTGLAHGGGGGALYHGGTSGSVTDCTFEDNEGGRGGALNSGAGLTIRRCTFNGNTASWLGGGALGSGTFIDCEFAHNSGGTWGGGLACGSGGSVRRCTFFGNQASAGGGVSFHGNCALRACTLTANRADLYGGGVFNFGDDASTVKNCVIRDNWSGERGGGAYSSGDGSLALSGCTLVGNSTEGQGGGVHNRHIVTLSNCVLWANSDETGTAEPAQLHGVPSVDFCCVQGWTGDLGGVGNMGANPLFGRDGMHLRTRSPCRNAGDPSFVPDTGETDIDGQPRVLDGRVDMGADEVALEFETPEAGEPVEGGDPLPS